MGVGQSTESAGNASPEELSYILAERFATKCFTPLELTHFEDNFFSRALDQGGLKYWNEKILSDFLEIPDGNDSPGTAALDAGPVVFRMVSYLGAFPFQNTLAPSVLTFEAMVKVVVLLTERYGKVLRRGRRDRTRLLFGSLADVGRKEEIARPIEGEDARSHITGFAIDEPAGDEEYDDDDDNLALAALESLDAIEVFKHDQRIDKTVYEARISLDTFRRLLMLLLVIAPSKPLESVSKYTADLSPEHTEAVRKEADSILASFSSEEAAGGISYKTFSKTVNSSLPYLFDPLTPLFEHLLFSKNLDLSQKRDRADSAIATSPEPPVEKPSEAPPSPITPIMLPGSFKSTILNQSMLSHISFFLPTTPSVPNFFRSGVRLHPVFSTSAHGSSLTSFSHHVMTWQSATLLILQGAAPSDQSDDTMVTIGVYLPSAWKTPSAVQSSSSSSSSSSKLSDASSSLPCLFQLSPQHLLLSGNPSPSAQKPNTPAAYFSTHTGIAIGCEIPPASRSNRTPPRPHGAGSILVDTGLEVAELHIAPVGTHDGVFLPPDIANNPSDYSAINKTKLDLYGLEVWGVVPDPETAASSTLSAVEMQRAKWDFEKRDVERRRNVNLKLGVGDSALENARWLLESAGLVGDNSGTGRSGGSV